VILELRDDVARLPRVLSSAGRAVPLEPIMWSYSSRRMHVIALVTAPEWPHIFPSLNRHASVPMSVVTGGGSAGAAIRGGKQYINSFQLCSSLCIFLRHRDMETMVKCTGAMRKRIWMLPWHKHFGPIEKASHPEVKQNLCCRIADELSPGLIRHLVACQCYGQGGLSDAVEY
jgi:hypothetical protein